MSATIIHLNGNIKPVRQLPCFDPADDPAPATDSRVLIDQLWICRWRAENSRNRRAREAQMSRGFPPDDLPPEAA